MEADILRSAKYYALFDTFSQNKQILTCCKFCTKVISNWKYVCDAASTALGVSISLRQHIGQNKINKKVPSASKQSRFEWLDTAEFGCLIKHTWPANQGLRDYLEFYAGVFD